MTSNTTDDGEGASIPQDENEVGEPGKLVTTLRSFKHTDVALLTWFGFYREAFTISTA